MRRLQLRKLGIVISLIVLIVLGSVCLLPFPAESLFPEDSPWTVKGVFQQDPVQPLKSVDPNSPPSRPHGLHFWRSWCGSDKNTGELQSPPFKAPAILEASVIGYPGNAGIGVFVQREDTLERIPLVVRRGIWPGETWSSFRWWIPKHVRGKLVRLVALDQSIDVGGWIGVSTPRQLSILALAHEGILAVLLMLTGYFFDFALFLLPGFALATLSPVRNSLKSDIEILIFISATGATLGYISFWLFFFGKPAGRVFTNAVYFVSAGLLLLALQRGKGSIGITAQRIRLPLIYAGLTGSLYLCLFFIFTNPNHSGANLADQRFFHEIRPGDNIIPQIFAEKLFSRQPLRPFCCGDWLSSDRPPLQSGIVLFERPLHIVSNADLDYELLTVALQSLWVCGAWCLLSSLGASPLAISQTLGFLVFSGFFFYNTVYTWPKFLAAAFVLFVLSIFFDSIRTHQPFTYTRLALVALCLGLALMAHPGSIFSLGILAVLIFRFRKIFRFTVRGVSLASSVAVLFVVPWSAYQKFVDPPGNRLIKMHLAGELSIDSRSAWQGIYDAYRAHTVKEIIQLKTSNLLFLAGRNPFDTFGVSAILNHARPRFDYESAERSRISQREWIWNAVGVLNAGWIGGLIWIARRRRIVLPVPCCNWLVVASIFNFILWSLLTFGPNATMTTHSSYADILLLSIGLVGFILTLPAIVRLSLLALQIFNLCVIWVWSYPPLASNHDGITAIMLQWPMLVVGGTLLAILFWMATARRGRVVPKLFSLEPLSPDCSFSKSI